MDHRHQSECTDILKCFWALYVTCSCRCKIVFFFKGEGTKQFSNFMVFISGWRSHFRAKKTLMTPIKIKSYSLAAIFMPFFKFNGPKKLNIFFFRHPVYIFNSISQILLQIYREVSLWISLRLFIFHISVLFLT